MTILESLPYALFNISVVFSVLIILSLIIKLFSFLVGLIAKNGKKDLNATPASEPVLAVENGPEMSCGELKLHNVDERTAAMIMAIVSDDSGIPLEELCFKSIKAKD
ncbi:MAG: OadG family transporter subunit [Oscillospiraceae bacterium]|nr:OadG family transporter subunit [Oscillospiraceae bacterium]